MTTWQQDFEQFMRAAEAIVTLDEARKTSPFLEEKRRLRLPAIEASARYDEVAHYQSGRAKKGFTKAEAIAARAVLDARNADLSAVYKAEEQWMQPYWDAVKEGLAFVEAHIQSLVQYSDIGVSLSVHEPGQVYVTLTALGTKYRARVSTYFGDAATAEVDKVEYSDRHKPEVMELQARLYRAVVATMDFVNQWAGYTRVGDDFITRDPRYDD